MKQGFDIRQFFKKWPDFYYAVAFFLGPIWWSGVSAKKYLRDFASDGKILNIGCGARKINDKRLVNIDITNYPIVDMIASADSIPLPDSSAVGAILDNVLEHLSNPQASIAEVKRLLASGGTVYIATPFMYPFHSSPYDYTRWTLGGLYELLGDGFEIIESGVRGGPCSALTSFLSHFFSIIFAFGNKTLWAILFNVFMILFLPIKLFDAIFAYYPGADELAAVLYVVAKKK